MNKKELVINITSNIVAFLVTFGINFILSPIIIKSLGKEAYGFYSLGNQFVSYATIISSALNSMASRFISIKIHKNNIEDANKYFSSVFFSNIILSLILLVPITLVICFLEVILSIPDNIVIDVKILWILLFVNFLITILTNVFKVGTFSCNKLYLSSIANIIGNIVKAVVLFLAFFLLKPKLWYMGIGIIIYTLIISISNNMFTKKLLPKIKIKKEKFEFKAVKSLITAGIWNSINQLASLLNTGVTLIITNIFVDAAFMGDVSITKTFVTAFFELIAIFSTVFSPQLLKIYATDKEKFNINIKFCMRILCFIVGTILGIFTIFGKYFYALWVPGENSNFLLIITILELLPFYICGSINVLNEVMVIKNKIKNLAISFLITGIASVVLTIIIVSITKYYNLEIFGLNNNELCTILIIGISGIIMLLRNLTYVVYYFSKQIGVKSSFVYSEYLRGFLYTIILIAISFLISKLIYANSWLFLIIDILIMLFISLIIGIIILLNKEDKKIIMNKIRRIK